VSVEDNVHVVSLTPDDISVENLCPCPCRRSENLPVFQSGDFVLVNKRIRLQPYRFEGYEGKRARLRKLDRRKEVEGTGKVNELVWTTEFEEVPITSVIRKCRVVKVEEGQEIPRLADWAGSSDWFFYRQQSKTVEGMREINDMEDRVITESFSSVTVSTPTTIPEELLLSASLLSTELGGLAANRVSPETSDLLGPPVTTTGTPGDDISEGKLRGLDLFCGGGNFGRGVADGGAVHHAWYPR
jgi:DNA (cytosine-5)-methyltransferase 1